MRSYPIIHMSGRLCTILCWTFCMWMYKLINDLNISCHRKYGLLLLYGLWLLQTKLNYIPSLRRLPVSGLLLCANIIVCTIWRTEITLFSKLLVFTWVLHVFADLQRFFSTAHTTPVALVIRTSILQLNPILLMLHTILWSYFRSRQSMWHPQYFYHWKW